MEGMDAMLIMGAVSSTRLAITRAVEIRTSKYTELTGRPKANQIWCESKATLISKTGKILDVALTTCLVIRLY